ncbi:MAG TPA: hypothetical protein VL051_09600 [Burkholderiaceae bacterium]|nr:hypothetical protein [Burkholderiaceae bacterium]
MDAPGVLLILNDVLDGAEIEFNRWYQQQHLSERLGIAGFKSGRRYQALGAQPAYMAIYECESIEVLSSLPYRERLANPTDWTKTMMPNFRNMLRSACRETWSIGDGMGGSAIVVQCKPIPGRENDARRFIKEHLGPDMMQADCLVRMSLWEADAAATGGSTAEMALRGGKDSYADWVLFMESYDLARMALALHTRILASEGAKTGLLIGAWTRYQLICNRTAASRRG